MATINENTIIGSEDDETISMDFPAEAGYATAVAFGNGGKDSIWNAAYLHAELHGGEGDDDLGSQSSLSDTLFGDAGSDQIYLKDEDVGFGGDGDDYFFIVSNLGENTGAAHGEAGNDVFVVNNSVTIGIDGGDGLDTAVLPYGGIRQRLNSIETIGIVGSLRVDGSILRGVQHITSYAMGDGGRYVPFDDPIRLEFMSRVKLDGSLFDKNVHGEIVGSQRDDVFDFSKAVTDATLNGGSGNDIVIGNDADNYLNGYDGSDTLTGGGGNDTIDTGSYHEGKGNVVNAGSGDDQILVNAAHNTVQGGAGDDLISASRFDLAYKGLYTGGEGDDLFDFDGNDGSQATIIGGTGHDVLVHTGKLDAASKIDVEELQTNGIFTSPDILNHFEDIEITGRPGFLLELIASGSVDFHNFRGLSRLKSMSVYGSDDAQVVDASQVAHRLKWSISLQGGDDQVIGSALKDKIFGGGGDDILLGNGGKDVIYADNGNDVINGGAGVNRLSGGAGADIFIFDQAPSWANFNVMTEFDAKHDLIVLDHDVYEDLDIGMLSSEAFHVGRRATNENQRILYDSNSGRLFYDSDGKGSEHAIGIAKLHWDSHLTNTNFEIVA